MTYEQVLFFISVFYFASMITIDISAILAAVYTNLTFSEFGKRNTAKRLINDGLVLAACAWTLFLIGAIPGPINPLAPTDRLMCYLVGVLLKDIGQPIQALGWWRFWRAMIEYNEWDNKQ